MRTESTRALILGAGPAGLAAAYTLARAGADAVLLERDKGPGGLMRSVRRGDFTVDVGRKELYNRLEKVDLFWRQLLGDDYRVYPHRGGLLYDGHILDLSPAYRGFRRGMPWGMFLGCSADFLWTRLRPAQRKPRNVEEYFYHERGRRLTRIVSQGFQEKLTGRRWADIPLAADSANGSRAGFIATLKGALQRTFSKSEPNNFQGVWRHPARGTGQICEALERGILEAKGRIHYGAKLEAITVGDGRLETVTAQLDGEAVVFRPEQVISSIPLEALLALVKPGSASIAPVSPGAQPRAVFRRKTVVLVYLFLDEEPRFPHAWLNVTCPKTRIGRITNYAALNGSMVPKGKTCLCCELYFFDEDSMLKSTDEDFVRLALDECGKYGLATPGRKFDHLVLRLPGADASQNRHNWLSKVRLGLLEELKAYRNLYYVNRTDLDIATLAGIEAAEAVLAGDRSTFDEHIDPSKLGIRSQKKAFEFKNPLGHDA